jgi:hypothetical protein
MSGNRDRSRKSTGSGALLKPAWGCGRIRMRCIAFILVLAEREPRARRVLVQQADIGFEYPKSGAFSGPRGEIAEHHGHVLPPTPGERVHSTVAVSGLVRRSADGTQLVMGTDSGPGGVAICRNGAEAAASRTAASRTEAAPAAAKPRNRRQLSPGTVMLPREASKSPKSSGCAGCDPSGHLSPG